MQTLAIILVILSALGGAVCFVMLIISLLNKNFSLRPKKILIIWSGCFAVFILSNIIGVATAPANNGSKSTTAKSEIEVKEQPKEKTEEEKAADEAKKKADEEAKAKADAEAKKAKEEADAKKAADEKVAYDTGITYNQLARTPDDYKGKKAKFTGRVIQVMEGDKETDLRIAVDGNSDTVLFVGYDPKITSTRVLENDNVTVKGKSIGIYSYQSTMGGKISIPGMLVDNIVINNK